MTMANFAARHFDWKLDQQIATIRLTRPERKNPLTFDSYRELRDTFRALADADEEAVLHAWQGLGYYRRARALHACARVIVAAHGGGLPSRLEELRALPGVGAYTAAAVAAIAYGRPVVPVDGNVERVLARLAAVETPLPGARRHIDALARELSVTPRSIRRDLKALSFAQLEIESVELNGERRVRLARTGRSSEPIRMTRFQSYSLAAVRRVFDVLAGTPFHDDLSQVFTKLAGVEVTSVFRDRHPFRPGEMIRLRPDPTRAHLFDAASGVRLAS